MFWLISIICSRDKRRSPHSIYLFKALKPEDTIIMPPYIQSQTIISHSALISAHWVLRRRASVLTYFRFCYSCCGWLWTMTTTLLGMMKIVTILTFFLLACVLCFFSFLSFPPPQSSLFVVSLTRFLHLFQIEITFIFLVFLSCWPFSYLLLFRHVFFWVYVVDFLDLLFNDLSALYQQSLLMIEF